MQASLQKYKQSKTVLPVPVYSELLYQANIQNYSKNHVYVPVIL